MRQMPGLALAILWLWPPAGMAGDPSGDTGRNGTIVVFRQGGANLAALSAVIGAAEAASVKLGRNQYVEIALPAGRHTLSARALGYAKHHAIEVELSATDRVYYELRPNARRPGLFTAAAPVAGEAAVAAEAAAARPFLFEPRSEQQFLEALPRLKQREAR